MRPSDVMCRDTISYGSPVGQPQLGQDSTAGVALATETGDAAGPYVVADGVEPVGGGAGACTNPGEAGGLSARWPLSRADNSRTRARQFIDGSPDADAPQQNDPVIVIP